MPLALFLAATGCANAGSVTSTTTTEQPTTIAEVTITAVPTTTMAPGSAPPEMTGQWRTDLNTGDLQFDRVSVSFDGTGYSVSRGPNSAGGKILVEGDRITFSNASVCDGIGVYQWSVDGGTLTLTMLDPPDPCSGRSEIFDGVVYSR
jgi:hypothetical protein